MSPYCLPRGLSDLTACIVAAAASLATPTPSLAASIDYVLSNVTATFPDGKDTITGNFTFDPATDTIGQVDIIVIGPVFPGRYNRAPVATPLSVTASEESPPNHNRRTWIKHRGCDHHRVSGCAGRHPRPGNPRQHRIL